MGKGTSIFIDVFFLGFQEIKQNTNGSTSGKALVKDVEQGTYDFPFVVELYGEKYTQFISSVAQNAPVRIHCNISGNEKPYVAPNAAPGTPGKYFTSLKVWKWEAIPSTTAAPQVPQVPQNAYVAPQPTQTAPAQQTYQAPVQATTPPSILPSALPAAPPYHSAPVNHNGHILCQNTMSGAWLYWNGSQWLPVPPQQTQAPAQAPAPAFNPAPTVAPGDRIEKGDMPF